MNLLMIRIDSGHGGQTKDLDGDEEDGYDEGKLTLSLLGILIHGIPAQ